MIARNYISRYLYLLLMLVFIASVPTLAGQEAPGFAKVGIPFLKQYCFGCHAGEEPAAELSLDAFPDNLSLIKNQDIWENVVDMLTTNQMPPSDSTQPPIEEIESFVGHVETIFEHAARTAKPEPGRVTVRRLNKVEYKNTVRDLLGVDFDPTVNFPADDIGHGFDNIGDVLTMSPLLMERYLEAAEVIAERVILVNPPPPARRYQRGQRLDPRHKSVPPNRFRLLDPEAEDPWKTGPFTTGAAHLRFLPDIEILYRATLYAETEHQTPVKVALFVQGKALAAVSAPDELAQLVGVDPTADNGIKILETFEITARDPKKPQTIETLVSRVANVEKAGIAMVKPAHGEPQAKLMIRLLWSEGPLDTRPASQRKILACTPNIPQAAQTREVLTRLLRRAYRRPPSEAEVEKLAQFVEARQAAGEKWEAGIQQALKIVLCSPKFLFRWELDDRAQEPTPYPLDAFQLASRLSYFLWSSMPDDELFALAEKKQLTANLEAQVKRMLADPKATELARSFGTQWLQIQRLTTVAPDLQRFPSFTPKLRQAMLKETELFLDSIFRENRSILTLLDADYTFLNQHLARHYGIYKDVNGKKIQGNAFQRVALGNSARGGILTQGSVLTVTSNPTRTSPVKRGRWVLEQILGSPPPLPPPNVPELEEEHEAASGKTLRQRLEQHRKDPACANCHAKMDPIGFALENYNAIGAFRTTEGELPIDTTGKLPDGTSFQGITDLKQILKDRKQHFAKCLTEKMLIYALGRGLAYYDRPTVERIVAELEAKDYSSTVLITEIVKSEPFRLQQGKRE